MDTQCVPAKMFFFCLQCAERLRATTYHDEVGIWVEQAALKHDLQISRLSSPLTWRSRSVAHKVLPVQLDLSPGPGRLNEPLPLVVAAEELICKYRADGHT